MTGMKHLTIRKRILVNTAKQMIEHIVNNRLDGNRQPIFEKVHKKEQDTPSYLKHILVLPLYLKIY